LRGLFTQRQRSGIAALEFGLIAPLFATMLAGTVDLSNYIHINLRLNAAVAAGSNMALINASGVNSSTGATLASNIADLVANSSMAAWANDVVVVNDGPSASITSGKPSSSGSAANADSCYCPTGGTGAWVWGSAVSCGSPCLSGSLAGKFVTVTASRPFTPLFAAFGIIAAGNVTAATMVQTQ
jgi:Flp pilus assembly protein TadG